MSFSSQCLSWSAMKSGCVFSALSFSRSRSFASSCVETDGNWRCGKLYWHPQVSFRVCDATIMVMMRRAQISQLEKRHQTFFAAERKQHDREANKQIFHINVNCIVERTNLSTLIVFFSSLSFTYFTRWHNDTHNYFASRFSFEWNLIFCTSFTVFRIN